MSRDEGASGPKDEPIAPDRPGAPDEPALDQEPPAESAADSARDESASLPDRKNLGTDRPGAPAPGVSMSRGAYLGLVATAIAGIAVGAFFAGYVISSDGDYVTRAQLESALARAEAPAAPAQAPRPAVSADDDPVLGSPDAPVTIIEFSDFECPFCSRFHRDTLPAIQQEYIATGVVKLVYRDFPIDRIHPNARAAHVASECADEQGMFWPYHDILFDRQGEWSGLDQALMRERVSAYASALQLDAAAFEECLESPAIGAEIDADKRAGSSYGVTGTPAFFVGSDAAGYEQISGAKPFGSFAAAIESALG